MLELINHKEEYEVEAILNSRQFGQGRKLQYLIKWLGYPDSENQWEPADKVAMDNLVREFQEKNPMKETHLRATQIATSLSSPHSMSSPDSFTLELNITPIPVLDVVAEARRNFPTRLLQSQPGYPQTAPKPYGLTWTQALRSREAKMTKEVSAWACKQLLRARQRQEEKRQRLQAAIAFREEDLGCPLPMTTAMPGPTLTANVVEREGLIVTAATDVATTGTTPVGFATYTSTAPLMPPNAGPVMSPSINESATHSQSHHCDTPMS